MAKWLCSPPEYLRWKSSPWVIFSRPSSRPIGVWWLGCTWLFSSSAGHFSAQFGLRSFGSGFGSIVGSLAWTMLIHGPLLSYSLWKRRLLLVMAVDRYGALVLPLPLFCIFHANWSRHEANTRGETCPRGAALPPPPRPSRVYEHKVYVAVYAQILQSEKEETIKKYI